MGIGMVSPAGAAVTGTEQILWRIIGANMNSTADQPFTKLLPFVNFLITRIRVVNASTNLLIAAGGVYTTTAKGGTPIVAAAQVFSGLTGGTLGLDLTVSAFGLGLQSASALYLSLTTAAGGASTADFHVFGYPLS